MAELRLSPKSWKRTSACFLTSLSTLIVTFMLFISKISNDIESQKEDVLKLTHIQNNAIRVSKPKQDKELMQSTSTPL